MLSLGGLVSSTMEGNLNLRSLMGGKLIGWWDKNMDTAGGTQMNWIDEVINPTNNSFGQNNAGLFPVPDTTPSGYPAILFDNTDDELNGAAVPTPGIGPAGVGEYLWSICYQSNAITKLQFVDLIVGGSDGITVPTSTEAPTHANELAAAFNTTLTNGAFTNSALDTNWHSYVAIVNEISGNCRLWQDGVLQTTQGTSQSMRAVLASLFIEIGGTGSQNLNGKIASRIICYDAQAFTPEDVVNITAYQNYIINGVP